MNMISGWGGRLRGLFTDTKGPWGPSGDGGSSEAAASRRRTMAAPVHGARPLGEAAARRSGPPTSPGLDELLRRSRARFGGGGGGGGEAFPAGQTDRSSC